MILMSDCSQEPKYADWSVQSHFEIEQENELRQIHYNYGTVVILVLGTSNSHGAGFGSGNFDCFWGEQPCCDKIRG